jgi:hypothetical protein
VASSGTEQLTAVPQTYRALFSIREFRVLGQAFGLAGTGLMVGRAVGAAVAGVVADALGHGEYGRAMALMAGLSLVTTCVLLPGLRRSAPGTEVPGARG